MSRKKLALNVITNLISYASKVIISFYLTPYIIKELGAEIYSFYSISNNIVNYITIFSAALSAMSARYITISYIKKQKEEIYEYYSSIFVADIILAVALAIPLSIVVFLSDQIFDIPLSAVYAVKILFALIFLNALLNICATVSTVATFALNRVELRSLADIVRNILRVVLYVVLFNVFTPNIVFVGIVTLIVDGTFILMNVFYTKTLLPELSISVKLFRWEKVKKVLFSGIWNSINQLGLSLLYGADLIIGNIFLGSISSGYLSIVHTIPNFSQGIINSLTSVFMPRITQIYAMDCVEDLVKEIKLSQNIMGMITNIPICVFMVIGSEFFALWVPGYDTSLLKILSILTIAHQLIVGVVFPISNLNTTMNRLRFPAIIMLGCGTLNIISMILLINFTDIGIYAVPMTTLVISIVWFGIFIPVYPCKKLKVPWWTFFPAIVRTLITSILIIAASETVRGMFDFQSWLDLILYCICTGILGVLINFAALLFTTKYRSGFIKKWRGDTH